MNGLFSTGERTQSPRTEQIPLLSEASYHDRLIQVLDMFEGMCTESEIRVVATARSEIDQWKLLNYDKQDKLWKRFERIEIPEPTDSAIVNLLDDSTKQADMKADPQEFEAIAHKSDGTYRNILLNLRRWQAQNKEVNNDDLTETLDGSWHDIYERAVKKYPAVKHIYDAIDMLRQANIVLHPFYIGSTATIVWDGNLIQRIYRRGRVRGAMHYLTQDTKIVRMTNNKELSPSDGQIEAKGSKADWSMYISEFEKAILDLGKIHTPDTSLVVSYLSTKLALSCLEAGRLEDAIRIWQKTPTDNEYHWTNQFLVHFVSDKYVDAENAVREAIAQYPNSSHAYTLLGELLRETKQHPEAEEAYRQAITKNPNNGHAYFRLGSLLRISERYAEAEKAYRLAITQDPNFTLTSMVFLRLGVVLWKLERYAESEDFLRKAIEKDPNYGEAYVNLGILLKEQKRFKEAEVMYRQAIDKDPNNAAAYNNLIILLRVTDRAKETIPLLEKMIEIQPENFNSYLGIASTKKMFGESIESSVVEKARQYILEDDFYNRACLESVCDNFDLAFEYLQKAAQKEKFSRAWAWEDPDLQWIRNDPRFMEIVGPKPEK